MAIYDLWRLKYFNFTGGEVPCGVNPVTPAYGMKGLKIEVQMRRRLCEPKCRRPGGLRGTLSPVGLRPP